MNTWLFSSFSYHYIADNIYVEKGCTLYIIITCFGPINWFLFICLLLLDVVLKTTSHFLNFTKFNWKGRGMEIGKKYHVLKKFVFVEMNNRCLMDSPKKKRVQLLTLLLAQSSVGYTYRFLLYKETLLWLTKIFNKLNCKIL